jgi:tetratricopeptide (TPR) repeat protein
MPAAEIVTVDTTAGRSVMPGEVTLDDIEAAGIKPGAAVDQSAREFAPVPAADQVASQADAAANEIDEVPVAGWYDSLQSRHRFIETLPVIGAAGSLAFVGRALQRVDAFIATSPSWASLAFGAWVTLMIVMLRNELLARRQRRPAVAARKPVVAAGVTSAEASVQVTPPELNGEPADKPTRRRRLPLQPPSESNARAIIAQADSILAGGDAEEAIKLMKLAVELQPNQPMLVNRLLELYHQTRRGEAFEKLMNDSSTVLENLDPDELARLQVIHSRLLPGTAFPLAHVLVEDSAATSEKDPVEAELTNQVRPVLNDEDINDLAESGAHREGAMPLFAAPGSPAGNIAVDDESDRDVIAASVSEDFSNRFDALEEDSAGRLDDEGFVETQVIYTKKGVPLRQQAVEQQSMVGEILDLAVTLKEVDVYLAYGLYDNAEELLLKGMEVDPDRADFLARLLDTYYATRNVVDFVSCAEVMLDMGDQGREYWEKVEIMGYELAPYNKLFAAGKDRSLSAVELGIPKPETADFDFSDIEEDGGEAYAEIEIDSDEEVEALSAELNLDLTTSAFEDTADNLEQILSLDTSQAPSIPTTSQHFDDDDISTFVLDEDDEVDVGAGEDEHIRSMLTSEILAIPETSDNSIQEDLSTGDPEPANEFDDQVEALDQLPSLSTSEILAIPETSALSDNEDSEAFEIDEDALAMDLDAVVEELDLDGESGFDDDDPDLDFDDEEVMKFTIEDTQSGLAASFDTGETSLSVVKNSSADALAESSGEKVDGRILYFPENNNEDRAISEFESEVKVTLQAIRDQLQHVTERLFRQERETSDLKQSIAELGKEGAVSAKKKNKKSS